MRRMKEGNIIDEEYDRKKKDSTRAYSTCTHHVQMLKRHIYILEKYSTNAKDTNQYHLFNTNIC
jgi:hypothetical protein